MSGIQSLRGLDRQIEEFLHSDGAREDAFSQVWPSRHSITRNGVPSTFTDVVQGTNIR